MTRYLRTAVAVAALLAGLATVRTAGQQQAPFFSPSGTLPLLESYLESLRQQSGIPGMSAALVRDGAIAWEKGFGFANLAARVRATPDTPYLVGDIAETFGATLLLQCVEQRHLSLDDPLSRYKLSDPEPTATIRQLLSHTSPEGSKDPFLFSPDRYAHLTEVVEACAPQPYRKSVAHRLLDGLAMIDSVPGTDLADPDLALPEGLFDPSDLERYRHVLERLAMPYKVDGKRRADRTDVPVIAISAANGLVTTVRDLAKFDAALTPSDDEDHSALLLPEMLNTAWTPSTGRNGAPLPTGLGWFVQYYNGERIVWHFGNVPNAYSALVVKLPARNVTFILLANSDGLTAPYQLNQGDVTKSPYASVFLKLIS
jgi:CubicO group peptidase (beta-lactamase class C family)